MRGLLALMVWLVSVPASGGVALQMDRPLCPPRDPAPDEKIVPDGAAFAPCNQGLDAFALQGTGAVIERRYSISPEWGNVVRAKLTLRGGAASAPLVCWSKPGLKPELFVDMGEPEGR